MFSSQASILIRNLPSTIFEQLCRLWRQMGERLGAGTLVVSDEALSPGEGSSRSNLDGEWETLRFQVLVSPEFSALLLGQPIGNGSSYQVSLTFEPKAIADFLKQLSLRLDHNPSLSDRLEQVSLKQLPLQDNFQSQFMLQLLEIVSLAHYNIAPSIVYPHFSPSQPVEKMLRNRLEQERILNQVTLQIRQNLDLLVIVKMTIEQVRRLLNIDRLVIYQLNVKSHLEDSSQVGLVDAVTYEALATEEIPSILNFQDETCFADAPECQEKYRQGFSLVVDDIETDANLSPCLKLSLKQLQVRAKLVTPILIQGKIWGFLIAHQCFESRKWKKSETKFLFNIAQYLAIAIYQAQSYQQLEEQKNILEQQMNRRAQELHDALLAAQAASHSKSEFLGTMSHELRTPLTCIIGLSSTLLRWSSNPENPPISIDKQRKYLQTIQESGRKLLELINDILDLSQIEAGKSMLNISEFSLRNLSRIILHSFQEKACQQEINLKLDFRVEKESDLFLAGSTASQANSVSSSR